MVMKMVCVALLLCSSLSLLTIAAGATCPSSGIICVSQCSSTWQSCSGSTTWAAQAVPGGTKCCDGAFVYPDDACCTGASTSAPATTTTARPATTTTSASTTKAPATTTKAPTTTAGGLCSLSQIFNSSTFTALFPQANYAAGKAYATVQYPIFTYNNLISAAASFPTFACTGTLAQRKLELAAFLAQTSQETTGSSGAPYNFGYCFSTELCSYCAGYCDPYNTVYPCVSGKNYNGRGPMQISWNYNYGQASQALYGDKNTLLNNPDLLLTDGVVAFKTALWFWMTAQSPKPSCHDVMTGGYVPTSTDVAAGRVAGFGLLTNIINGGIECGRTTSPSAGSANRVGFYNTYTKYFGVPDTNNLYCNNMLSY